VVKIHEEEKEEEEKQIDTKEQYIAEKLKKTVTFKKVTTHIKNSLLDDMMNKQLEHKEKSRLLKEQKGKLGRCARIYMCLHKKRINHIFFLNEVEDCSTVRK